MYLEHFGLYTAPFSLVPHLRFLYQSKAFEETMAHLVYGLEGGEDFILITGEIGSGKTLALHNLSTHVSSIYEKIIINVTQVSYLELLKLILIEMGVDVAPGADRADLISIFKKRLEAIHKQGRLLLLVVDEAQNLETEVLEGVRLLANLGPSDVQYLQVVLSGQPGLRKRIDSPDLVQLRQRIRVHYHLHALTERETAEYIAHRMKVAGNAVSPFTSSAVQRIHNLSGGVPRLVNILADRGLLEAFVNGKKKVDAKDISDEDIAKPQTDEAVAAARAAAASAAVPPPPAHRSRPDQEPVPAASARSRSRTWLWFLTGAVSVVAIVVLLGLWQGWWSRTEGSPAEDARPEAAVEAIADTTVAVPAHDVGAAPDTVASGGPDTAIAAADTVTAQPPAETPEASANIAEASVQEPPSEIPPITELKGVVIHVGSYRTVERARRHVASLLTRGYETKIYRVQINGEPWYRVYLGPWESMSEAYEAETDLRRDGLVSWTMVVRRG